MSTNKRLRGHALDKARKRMRSEQPLCVHCLAKGCIRAWDELDHIDGDPTNNAWENFQGLCLPCHQSKTAKDMGYRVRVTVGLDGYPVDG